MSKPILQYQSPPQPSLGQSTAIGFLWMLAQTVGTKFLNIIAQVVLAWLLSPKDFGLVGMAFSVTALTSLFQQAGLREILIHRGRSFERWAGAVFGLSAATGLFAAVATAALAPLAARLYGTPELTPLILVLAPAPLISALMVVPQARLDSQMRFAASAMASVIGVVVAVLLSVTLAWQGWGAMSFIVSHPIGLVAQAAILWLASREPVPHRLRVRRWRYVAGDGFKLLSANFAYTVINQGDYVALGLFHPPAVVGLYFFGFNLSAQMLRLLSVNLTTVLFPALTNLRHDPVRQRSAFLHATRLLAIVGMPACLLQAGLADPLVRLVFDARWYAAIPIIQILSVGMSVRLVASLGDAMLKSQGRFGALLKFTAIYAGTFAAAVAGAALVGGAIAVSIACAACLIGFAPIQLYIVLRPLSGSWRDIWQVYAIPTAVATIAVVTAVIAGFLLPHGPWRDWGRVLVVLVISTGIYLPLIRFAAPTDWSVLVDRFLALIPVRLMLRKPSLSDTDNSRLI